MEGRPSAELERSQHDGKPDICAGSAAGFAIGVQTAGEGHRWLRGRGLGEWAQRLLCCGTG